MRFRASIELAGKTATGIEVPAAVVAKTPETGERRIAKAVAVLRERRT